MGKKLFSVGVIFLLLVTAAATPFIVRAEGDSPPNSEPVKPPWITGKNPLVSKASNPEEDLTASGIIDTWQGVEVPLLTAPPSYVELEPQIKLNSPPGVRSLAIPQRYQNPSDVTCGAAALGMALEFLSLNGEGQAPSQDTLVGDLKNSGLLYETGTGVEELAYLARQHGYQGTIAFHNWTLEQLGGQLAGGRPVVVSLGANGVDQPGHFMTLTGISEDGSWVSYNDPILGIQTVLADEFIKSWNLQGNSGLVVQKEALSAMLDPMLPWMGLFSTLTMLAVMAKHNSLNEEFKGALGGIRDILSNPLRKGLGGMLIAEGGSKSAPRGYEWVKKTVPVYGWKDTKITLSRQVPILERKIIKAGTKVTYVKVPRYRTVRVDEGSWATHKVTKYRNQRYRKTERYKVKKYYWYRKNGRFKRGSYYTWKTRTVVKTRKVSYTTTERYWKSKWVTKKVFDGYTSVRKEEPVYEYRMLPTGRTRTEYYTDIERRWGQIGTDIRWDLVKLPVSTVPKTEIDWQKKEEQLGLPTDVDTKLETPVLIPPGYTREQWEVLPYGLRKVIMEDYLAKQQDGEDLANKPDESVTNNDPDTQQAISLSQEGLSTLIYKEGDYQSLPYNDNDDLSHANCTIGYGHLLHTGPCTGNHPLEVRWMKMGEEERKKELEQIFHEDDVRKIELNLNEAIDQDVLTNLTQEQFDALVVFNFNLGPNSYWVQKVVDHLNGGEVEKALEQMLRCNMVKDTKTGEYVQNNALAIRRLEEAILYLTGVYPPYLEEHNYASFSVKALTELYEDALAKHENKILEGN